MSFESSFNLAKTLLSPQEPWGATPVCQAEAEMDTHIGGLQA